MKRRIKLPTCYRLSNRHNRLMIILLCLGLWLPAAQAQYTLTASDVVLSPNGSTITNYTNPTEKNIIIPASIDGAPITAIAEGAFRNKGLTEVFLSGNIVSIGAYAFADNALTNFTFSPRSENDSQVLSRLKKVGANALSNNAALGRVRLPYIKNPFSHNHVSEEVRSDYDNAGLWKQDDNAQTLTEGLLRSANYGNAYTLQHTSGSQLLLFEALTFEGNNPLDKVLGDAPFTVRALSDNMDAAAPTITYTSSNTSIATVNPNGRVTIVDKGRVQITAHQAAYNSEAAREGILTLNVFAAYPLTSTDVTLSGSTITDYTNSTQKKIVIPASINGVRITAIAEGAFRNKGLTEVTLPDGLTTLGARAFADNQLTALTLPNSLTTLGAAAFNDNAIARVNNQASRGIIYARNSDGTEDNTTIASYGGTAVDIDFIPTTVTTIGMAAFSGNNLNTVTLAPNVETIGADAFRDNALAAVSFQRNFFYRLRQIGTHAFSGNAGLTQFRLPNTLPVGIMSYYANPGNWQQDGSTATLDYGLLESDNFANAYTLQPASGSKLLLPQILTFQDGNGDEISQIFKILVDDAFNISATSNNTSGSAITYSSGDDEIATVTPGGRVTLVKAGRVTLTATQAGSGDYAEGHRETNPTCPSVLYPH